VIFVGEVASIHPFPYCFYTPGQQYAAFKQAASKGQTRLYYLDPTMAGLHHAPAARGRHLGQVRRVEHTRDRLARVLLPHEKAKALDAVGSEEHTVQRRDPRGLIVALKPRGRVGFALEPVPVHRG